MRNCHYLILTMLLVSFSADAKTKHVSEITQLPENKQERDLWDLAVGHEKNIADEGRLVEDAQLTAYLEQVGARLIGDRLDHLAVDVRFIVVQNNLLSAWVYPYGTIAVNTGLLTGMENEAQLAAILAHEISHFMQRHSYKELIADKRQGVLGKGIGLLATAAVAAKTGVVDTGLMKAGALWTDLVTSGYSRKNEHIADAEGLALMAAAGYDRGEAIKAFEILKQNAAYGVVSPSLLWSSHPTLDDRLKNLGKAVKKAQRKKGYQAGEIPDSETYYRAVAPAVLRTGAQDLREGYFTRARQAFEKYARARPEEGNGHFLIGETWRLASPDGPDFAPRLAAYETAVEVEPDYAFAWKEIGMSHRQQANATAARDAFERYLALSPDAIDAGIIRWYLANPND